MAELGTCERRGCDADAVDVATLCLEDSVTGRRTDQREYRLCEEHLGQLLHMVVTAGRPPPDEWDFGGDQ